MAGVYHIEIDLGSDYVETVTVPFPLTGCTVESAMAPSAGSAEQVDFVCVVTDEAGGVFTRTMPGTSTAALAPVSMRWVHDLVIVGTETRIRLYEGNVLLKKGVTVTEVAE